MKNIKLVLEYDGTNYSGWQTQKNANSIQGNLDRAISKITGENIKTIGASRTDRRVHSLGQVANFITRSNIPGGKYKLALKKTLPSDISIISSEEVDQDFHSRFDAKAKKYLYRIYNGKLPRALIRNYSYHYPYEISMDTLNEASKYFIGRHDFSAFMFGPKFDYMGDKEIYKMEAVKKGDIIEITIVGNSFLRYQVRIMVGTLALCGSGKIPLKMIPEIIKDGKRDQAGKTFGAEGLFLVKVYY